MGIKSIKPEDIKEHDPPMSTTIGIGHNAESQFKEVHDQPMVHITPVADGCQRIP